MKSNKSLVIKQKLYSLRILLLLGCIIALWNGSSFAEQKLSKVIYTGTFDPPTRAHLQIIQCALGEANINESCNELGHKFNQIIILVNTGSHLKDPYTSATERMMMLKNALKKYGDRVLVMATTDLERDNLKSTMEADGKTVYQMIGADSFLSLSEKLFMQTQRSKFIVIPRESESISQLELDTQEIEKKIARYPTMITLFPKLERYSTLSSTLVRKSLQDKQPTADFLDTEVETFIMDMGLYQSLPPELESLSKAMFFEGFEDFKADVAGACPQILKNQTQKCAGLMEDIQQRARLEYKSSQSESRWGEKYVEAVLRVLDSLPNYELEKPLMEKSLPFMVGGLFQGKPYGKLPHLTPVAVNYPITIPNNEIKRTELKLLKTKPLECSASESFQDKSQYNMSIDRYLYDRFPKSLIQFLRDQYQQNKYSPRSLVVTNVTLKTFLESKLESPMTAQAVSSEIESAKATEGISIDHENEELFLVQTRRGQPHRKLYLVYNHKYKTYRLFATQVTGEDRRSNVFCQLKLSGAATHFYDILSENQNSFQLNSAGKKLSLRSNDIFLFGYKTAWMDELTKEYSWKRTVLEDSPELGLEMLEINRDIEGGEVFTQNPPFPKLILARNVFGDEAKQVLEILYKIGLRKAIYMGTAGALMDWPIGSIVIPTTFIDKSLRSISFDQSWGIDLIKNFLIPSGRIVSTGQKQAWAPHLFDETRGQLMRWRRHGAVSIDVEGLHIAEFRQTHPDFKMANFYIISDQTLGKTTIEQSNSQTKLIAASVHSLIQNLLPQIIPKAQNEGLPQ